MSGGGRNGAKVGGQEGGRVPRKEKRIRTGCTFSEPRMRSPLGPTCSISICSGRVVALQGTVLLKRGHMSEHIRGSLGFSLTRSMSVSGLATSRRTSLRNLGDIDPRTTSVSNCRHQGGGDRFKSALGNEGQDRHWAR